MFSLWFKYKPTENSHPECFGEKSFSLWNNESDYFEDIDKAFIKDGFINIRNDKLQSEFTVMLRVHSKLGDVKAYKTLSIQVVAADDPTAQSVNDNRGTDTIVSSLPSIIPKAKPIPPAYVEGVQI